MKKIYIKPIAEVVTLGLSEAINYDKFNVTSWAVDGHHEGTVIEGDPEGEIDTKGSNWNGWDD